MLVCIPAHILAETSSAEAGVEIAASHHVDLSDYLMGPFDTSSDMSPHTDARSLTCRSQACAWRKTLNFVAYLA